MSDESDPKDLPVSPDEVSTHEQASSPEADSEDERLRALIKKAVGKSKSDPPPELGFEPGSDEEAREAATLDEVDLKDALRGALRPAPGAVAPSLLKGVQRKLRTRSRGKFYGDGWSTSESPKTTYLVTSIIMLVLVVLVFFALVPWSTNTLP
jgi:hypothetical protein